MSTISRWCAGLLLSFAACAQAGGDGGRAPWPPVLAEALQAELDDPQAALQPARERAAAAAGEERLWRLIVVARLESTLELDDAATQTLARAADVLAALPAADASAWQWLKLSQLRHAAAVAGGKDLLPELIAFRRGLPQEATPLLCELLDIEAWVLNQANNYDEAWRTAEALDACGAETGWTFYRALAALTQGMAAASVDVGPETGERVADHFRRADASVEPGPGRFLRSLIAYGAGTSFAELKMVPEALAQMKRALATSRTLSDLAGIAAAQIEIAALDLDAGKPADAFAPLDEADAMLARLGEGGSSRSVRVHTLRLRAAALTQRGNLRALLAVSERIKLDGVSPDQQQSLFLARAEAHAALGQHAEAYAEMREARELDKQARQHSRDIGVLALQARYDNARRDAEIASLRHREEAARLSIEAQAATQRGLWIALVALVAGLAAAAALGWRLWKRRRELSDLALRDELTGLPNRRAIEAYARAQMRQSQRLGLPFSLALVDLDHFKLVNDRFGHQAGDALLKAFAQGVPSVLRAPDRLGRWGGEEFLLVLPGTRADELGGVFARLLTGFATTDAPGLPSPHGVTFSMGGAEAGPQHDFGVLLDEADRKLYAAKGAGRATWR